MVVTPKALTDVATLNPRSREVADLPDETLVSFIPMPAVSEHSASIETNLERPLGEVRRGFTYFRENDVLLAKITPCMENGKMALATGLKNGIGFGTTEFHVLRAKEGILPKYLYYNFRQQSYRDLAKSRMRGAVGQQRVPTDFFNSYSILSPHPKEQARIVELLDQADALRKLRSQADEKAARILPALFHHYFGDPSKTSGHGKIVKLGDVFNITSGATPRTAVNENYGDDHAWATPVDLSKLTGCYFSESKKRISDLGYKSCSTNLVPRGSVLLSSRAPIGLVAITDVTSVCHNQGIKSFPPNEQVTPEFLYSWLMLNNELLNRHGRGATFKEISSAILRGLDFPIFDKSVQDKFSSNFKTLQAATDKSLITKQKLEDLFQLLLHRAFTGELTAKWREDHMNELVEEIAIQAKA